MHFLCILHHHFIYTYSSLYTVFGENCLLQLASFSKYSMRCLFTCAINPHVLPSLASRSLQRNRYAHGEPQANCITRNRSVKHPRPTHLDKNHSREQSTLFLFNLCLQLYVNADEVQEARNLFDEMIERTLVSWTILMSGYARHGPGSEALVLFKDMLSWGGGGVVWPDSYVYAIVLRVCGEVGDLDFGRVVHGNVLKRGCVVDGFVENALVNMYVSCGSLGDAVVVFDGIERPDLIAWSSMLNGYVKNKFEENGFNIFLDMVYNDVELDAFVLSTVIKACTNLADLDFGIQLHCCIIKMGFGSNSFLGNSLMDFYAKCGALVELKQVFDLMNDRDLVSWNTLIIGYVHNTHYLEAIQVFGVLMNEVSCCDDFTIATVLKAVTALGDLEFGRQVHGYMVRIGLGSNHYVISSLLDMYTDCIEKKLLDKSEDFPLKLYINLEGGESNGFLIASMLKWCSLHLDLEIGKIFHSLIIKLGMSSDPYVVSSLVNLYSKCGTMEAALRIFMRAEDPGTTTWSALISGLSWNGRHAEALMFLQKMQFDGIEANDFTFTSVLLACLAIGDLKKGKEVHCKILRTGYGSNIAVVNMVINLYAQLQEYKQALKLCSLISETQISWNILIDACLEAKDYETIHNLLSKIQLCGAYIDPNTASNILSSCADPVFLNVGTQAHAYTIKRGLISHHSARNSLIKMYSACGKIADADLAFKLVTEKNSVSWTNIISAKVEHGHPSEALALFKDMQRKNKSADTNTLKSVLKAFAQTCQVKEAYRLLMSMGKIYGIEPSEEHYSCMVEALGRAEMLEEVEEFIDGINPVKVGTLTWKTLVSCCLAHGNMKLAKYALEKLLELDENDMSAQLLLKQALLLLGKWDDASKMKLKNNMRTNSSWIGVGSRIYEFLSDESVTNEVSEKLAEIEEKMEELGYLGSRNDFLHQVEEEGYDIRSLHHTEMKAIAFGLKWLPHGIPIRVIKSVRMSEHCHSVCKFISTLTDQELTVKDPMTFHHFRNGKCSCGDLW